MNGQRARAATGSTSGTASERNASGKTASRNPQKALPTSPMKMRAGCQLLVRNPSEAPAHAAAITATGPAPQAAAAAAIPAATAAAVIPAMPSLPSMKLKAFVRPTIQSSVNGQASGPKRTMPNEPRSTRVTGPSTATAATAAARCTANRVRLRKVWTSSSQLTAAIARAGTMAPLMRSSSSGLTSPITTATATTTMTIDRPPPRGVLRVWLLRAFGASMMPRATVHSISPRVNNAAATREARHHAHHRPIVVIVRLSPA